MSKNRITQFVIFTFCVLLSAGCAKKASEEIDFGTVKDSVYQNEYFAFKLPLPTDWSVQNQEMREELAKEGAKMVAGEDKRLKAAIKASEQKTANLLAAFKHPVGTPVDFNPNIICVAEQVRLLPGIKRGEDYHMHAKKLMESSQMKVEFPNGITAQKLGGKDFDVMDARVSVGPMVVKQKYYATIMKGYALVFIVSYMTADEEAALQKIVEGLSFNDRAQLASAK